MDNIKYYKAVHADGTVTYYDADGVDGWEIDEPNDANEENTVVLYEMEKE